MTTTSPAAGLSGKDDDVRTLERLRSGRSIGASGLVLIAVMALAAGACARRQTTKTVIPTEVVSRQNITVTVEATGTVEPIDLVEVKSKASGQITHMPVEIGTTVRRGQLMVQIDTRDVKNAYDQTRAALVAAQARVQVTRAQKKRSDQLFSEQVITAAEHETAMLDDANSQAQLVKARTDLDLARQRLEDATVSAPIAGTVLAKPVSVGQVISSATSSVSGGTTLLQMADLSRIRIRALVSETDIGNVRPGQEASVAVDAYPQRPFRGTVEKIEPQAVVEQSVTMFPVLVSIDNEQGLLMPGMNGEVTMMVDERDGVIAVPTDALRSAREIAAMAKSLGLNPDSVTAQIQAQAQSLMMASRAASDTAGGGLGAGRWRAGGPGGAGGAGVGSGAAGSQGNGAGRGFGRGGGATGSGENGGRFAGRRGGGRDSTGGGGRWRGRSGAMASNGPGAGAGASANNSGGAVASGANRGAGGGSGFGGGRRRTQAVVVKTNKGYEPRAVRIGISNYDYAEVLQGVNEGELVVMLGVVDLQNQRNESMSRIRQRMGSGLPGSGGGAGGGGTRGGSGGGSGGGTNRGGGGS
jgi:HlyD family secretion protein